MYQPSKNALIGRQALLPSPSRSGRLALAVSREPERRGMMVSLALHLGIAALLLAAPIRSRVMSPPPEISIALLSLPPAVPREAMAAPVVAPPPPPEAVMPAPPEAAPLSAPAPTPASLAPALPPQVASPPPRPRAEPVRRAAPERLPATPAAPHLPQAAQSHLSSAPEPAPQMTPARPVAGMSSNHGPAYPPLALRRREEGVVWLLVDVTADGQPQSVAVQRSSGHEALDAAAAGAVRQWRFIPATRNGTAIAATASVPVDFRINP